MNFNDLKYLVAVAEHGHFGKAALASHISQPTLSMQLKKLEDTLGVRLFERSNKTVRITAVGEEIAARARAILRDAEALRDIARAAQDPFAGEFRLGLFPTLAPYFLPPIIPALRKRLPKLKLLLVEEKTENLLERLKGGLLDAALLAYPVQEDGLDSARLFDDPFLLAVPRAHPFAKLKKVRQADLADEKLLLLEEGHCLRAQALEVCGLAGASEQTDFRATSLETLRQMVAAGAGITLMPRTAVTKDKAIAYIPFADPPPARSIGLFWRKQTARRAPIQLMAELFAR